MEQATKKEKVITKKGLIIKKYTFKSLMYIGLFLPMFVLFCVNYDKYFATNKDSFSVASGGVLMAIFTALLARIGIKKLHKLISASFVVAIIWCLHSIIQDFLVIACMFWIGIAIYSIFEMPNDYYTKLLDTWNDEETRMIVRKKHFDKKVKENNGEESDDYGQI